MVLIIIVLVGAALLLGVALVISMYDGGLGEVTLDHGDLGLPDRLLTAADLPGLRFRTGVRGYRMEDVDAAMERLGEALRIATEGAPQVTSAVRHVGPTAETEVGEQ